MSDATPITDRTGAGDWYCPTCGYLDGSRVTFHETCDECHSPVTWISVDRMDAVKVLEARIAELQAIADRVKPEALEAEIQAVKDEHAAIMKRLEDGAVGALDRLLTAAKGVVNGASDLTELSAAIIAAEALPDEMEEAAEPELRADEVQVVGSTASCKICEREIPIGETVRFCLDGSVTCHDCATAELN